MRILNLISPIAVYHKAVVCFKEVSNYRFYRKKIKELEKSGALEQKAMRADMLKRVYFVINLLPETLLAGQDSELLERSRVTEAIAERNQIFMKDNLLELVEADYERIKTEDYYAYLIWIRYRTISTIGDWVHVLLWLVALGVLAVNYHYLIDGFVAIKNLYQQINN